MPQQARYVFEEREDDRFLVDRAAFFSDEVLKLEQERIFQKCWIYIGHDSEIRNPGDYLTRNVAGYPMLFARDNEGVVRAMVNVCPHRGAIVCRERSGNARSFHCMYHGWTFNNDGTLRGAPGQDAYGPKFDKARYSLPLAPRLECYRDFWFVNFDSDAVDLHTYLAGAKDYIDIILDQSPSGKMEIISGTQEYDIKANWKLLVENSVDDYHILITHRTWINYMSNSGVDMRRKPGEMLPKIGRGIELGNGHLTTDNPNYRGRPVAAWISVYGEEAKEDVANIKAELVARLGEARAERVANTNRNLVIFPNLVINDGSSVTVRNFTPVTPSLMKVTSFALGPVEETQEQRARRLHAFLTFYGPGGFATPDDIAALEAAQEGYSAYRIAPFNDISRGMHKPMEDQFDTDEGHIRVFWRRWRDIMESA